MRTISHRDLGRVRGGGMGIDSHLLNFGSLWSHERAGENQGSVSHSMGAGSLSPNGIPYDSARPHAGQAMGVENPTNVAMSNLFGHLSR